MYDDDDYDDDGGWGYDGDPVHDSWVDYTTDQYEDTNYSGENYDYTRGYKGGYRGAVNDVDQDADLDEDYYDNRDYVTYDNRHLPGTNAEVDPEHPESVVHPMSHKQYTSRIHGLETLMAASLAAAAIMDKKSERATKPRNARKYRHKAEYKRQEAKRYKGEIDKLNAVYQHDRRNSIAHIACIIITILLIIYIIYSWIS